MTHLPSVAHSTGLENFWRDLRFGLRSLAKTPGFTVTAIIILAVGIGANTAIFSVVNTILLKPLNYPDPQSLVQVMNGDPQGTDAAMSVPKLNIWRQQTSIFRYVACYDQGRAVLNLTDGDTPEQVQA